METMKCSEANLVVRIEPSKSGSILDAVKRELSSLLFQYNEAFDGVLLSYDFIIQSDLGKILSLYPYISVSLKANLLLFNPKPETYLEGKVVKLAEDKIHVVVLGFSFATIEEEGIREEFKFKIKRGQESFRSTSNKRHVITIGTIIRFFVKSFDEEMLHISGSLIPPSTGSMRWLCKNSEEIPKKDRKRVKSEELNEEAYAASADGGALSNDYHVLKKAKKERLHEKR